jgi:hypothetical protein
MLSRIYYCYELLRSDLETPFYVGMGKEDRWKEHQKHCRSEKGNKHKNRIIRTLLATIGYVPMRKVAMDLPQIEAWSLEVLLIAKWGRAPHGPLTNLTDGGEGGRGFSADALRRIAESSAGRNIGSVGPWRGKTRSDEAKKVIGDFHRGKAKPPEQRQKMSESALKLGGKSEKTKARMKASAKIRWARDKVEKPAAVVRPFTRADEARSQVGLRNRGRVMSANTRAKMAAGQQARRERESQERSSEISFALQGGSNGTIEGS